MGNSLQKDYQISEVPTSSTGIFQIFPAANKKTKEHVSIFRCKVKDLEAHYGVRQSKEIIVRLRKAATLLTRLQHPNILRVLQPPLETRSEFYMVTEPVIGTLHNIVLHHWDSSTLPQSPATTPSPTHARQKQLSDIEIRFGLMQVADALAYLRELRICHLNLTPESVFISNRGDWKLDAFTFATYLVSTPTDTSSGNSPVEPAFDLNDPLYFNKIAKSPSDTISSTVFAPDLDFASPEYVTKNHYSFSADIFSFACLYYLLRSFCYMQENASSTANERGRKTVSSRDIDAAKLITSNNNLQAFQNAVNNLAKGTSSENNNVLTKPFLSQQQTLVLQKCVSLDTAPRPDPQDLLNDLSLFGEDVRALRFLASMAHKDFESKTFFMKNLPGMLNSFPDHVLVHKVLPPLTVESKRNAELAICALPNILKIAEKMNHKRFTSKIMPTLGRLFMATAPADIPLLCLRSMHVILEKTNEAQQRHTVFPFLLRSLKNEIPSVQIESLRAIEACSTGDRKLLNYTAFRRAMLPQILSIVKETANPIIRQTAVETLMNTIHFIEKQVVVEEIIPTLEYCLSIDRSREICVMIIRIYAIYSQKSHAKEIATKLLPVLVQLSVEPSLQFEDFVSYMDTLRGMLKTVEEYRLSELERMETLRRIQQHQEASLEDQQQLYEERSEERMIDANDPQRSVYPSVEKRRSPSSGSLENFIRQQEEELSGGGTVTNEVHEYAAAHSTTPERLIPVLQPAPLDDTPEYTRTPEPATPNEPYDGSSGVDDSQTPQGQPERRKRSGSDSKRRDENFENLLNRFMSDPGTPQELNSTAEEEERLFSESTSNASFATSGTDVAPVSSMADSWHTNVVHDSTPVDVSAHNPMDFFGMDKEESTTTKARETSPRDRSDSHDRTFESLMSRVDSMDLEKRATPRVTQSSVTDDDDVFESLLAKHSNLE